MCVTKYMHIKFPSAAISPGRTYRATAVSKLPAPRVATPCSSLDAIVKFAQYRELRRVPRTTVINAPPERNRETRQNILLMSASFVPAVPPRARQNDSIVLCIVVA